MVRVYDGRNAGLIRQFAVPSEETPTGFKWIMRAGSDAAPLVYGYEEALGYTVSPSVARDKDGIYRLMMFTA